MPPMDAPSPTPSSTGNKRSRQSTGGAQASSRSKRRKAEDSVGPESEAERNRRPVNFGVGMVKGREEEWTEPADVRTKIDFLELPVEALYKYLAIHDLLPHWSPSPWSEEPCELPSQLYTIPPPPPVVPIIPSPQRESVELEGQPEEKPNPPVEGNPEASENPDDEAAAEAAADEERNAPPTTRSRTAPMRQVPTPSPNPTKRGVMTYADVYAARAVLAEKANQHWAKGLGGGQNREGETIVNFLYKNKVGHSEFEAW